MAIRSLSMMGHPVLRKKARELTRQELLSPSIQRLIDDMTETMRDAEGVGLAAPQVYEEVRLFMGEVRPSEPDDETAMPLLVMANPVIVRRSKEIDLSWEGCLSIPDIKGIVPRHRAILVQGLDREGNKITVEAQGFHARILQHEIDHLDGILYLDRMTDMQTLTYQREFERFWLHTEEGAEEVE